ncbi:MAG TPA: hypothetical protein VE783_08940, partial [Candidatus Limnocylindrales bacterium]|nr:hypothetical protein [Candidatus Limnocylindrales bacterium]
MACIVGLIILRAAASAGDDPTVKVKAEVTRLQQSLEKDPLRVAEMPEIGKDVANYLKQAET